jgi:hypothetical protein
MRVASDLRDARARTAGSTQPKSTLIEGAMPHSAAHALSVSACFERFLDHFNYLA